MLRVDALELEHMRLELELTGSSGDVKSRTAVKLRRLVVLTRNVTVKIGMSS